MGTTLENGVYLPSEGERNCYAGLKTNWEILDQKVADVTALQQAVAGALHREIVESLPTTDIDPNTIYMILSGTSATENVYNEFMYVNNAWELIGTSATDLTNYYTKAEVDGKLLLKASASDLTSHTGDTTIHVTTADKNKWNNNTYVFRYSSTALVASSTNSNTLLDNVDNLKVGDKVIDSNGVLFSITAIDSQNSTFTIGTALIDLAQDSDVVHKSGDETVGGIKSFSDDTFIKSLNFTNEVASPSSSSSAIMPLVTTVTYTDQTASKTARVNLRITASGDKSLYPNENNQYALGLASRKWSEVHGVTYYYGSSDVEFSTKFVTTDTDQSITGLKDFTDYITSDGDYLGNEASANQRTNFLLRSNRDTAGKSGIYITKFRQNRAQGELQPLDLQKIGFDVLENEVRTNNVFDIQVTGWSGNIPTQVNIISSITDNSFGSSYFPCKINNLEPSSLSLPDLSNGIDISSYITIGDTDNNYYTPSVNGWIWAKLIGNGLAITQGDFGSYANYVANTGTGEKWVETCLLVTKDVQATIRCRGITGIISAKFYPCLGNV